MDFRHSKGTILFNAITRCPKGKRHDKKVRRYFNYIRKSGGEDVVFDDVFLVYCVKEGLNREDIYDEIFGKPKDFTALLQRFYIRTFFTKEHIEKFLPYIESYFLDIFLILLYKRLERARSWAFPSFRWLPKIKRKRRRKGATVTFHHVSRASLQD